MDRGEGKGQRGGAGRVKMRHEVDLRSRFDFSDNGGDL